MPQLLLDRALAQPIGHFNGAQYIANTDFDENPYTFDIQGTGLSGILYVDYDAGGLNDGSTWANAYTNPILALGVAVSGDEIWVADGTYIVTNSSICN